MTQTSVLYSQAAGFPGMKADLSPDYCRSAVNGEASAEIAFGTVVAQGTPGPGPQDDVAVLMTAANNKLLGVTVHSHSYDRRYELGTVGVKPKVMLTVMVRGTIYVRVEEAVVKGDIPYARYADGTVTGDRGTWRKSADSTSAVKLTGCEYLASGNAGDVVPVMVDFNEYRASQG